MALVRPGGLRGVLKLTYEVSEEAHRLQSLRAERPTAVRPPGDLYYLIR